MTSIPIVLEYVLESVHVYCTRIPWYVYYTLVRALEFMADFANGWMIFYGQASLVLCARFCVCR